MKKIKGFLLALVSAVLAFSIPLATACDTSEDGKPQEELLSITVNSDSVRKEYYVGEDFTSAGLTVTAEVKNLNNETETRNITNEVVIDSSAYNKNEAGEYAIVVSYTMGEITKSQPFSVTVMEIREGLYVEIDGVTEKTIYLDANNKSAEIDLSKVVVKKVEYGKVLDGDIKDQCTLTVYKEDKKIEAPYTGLVSGTYQVWASTPAKEVPTYTLEAFARIYVVEEVVENSFKFVSGKTTQNIGVDEMTETWTYEIQYASSETSASLSYEDVTVSGVNTLTEGTRNATVTYTYIKPDGNTTQLSVSVPYTITKGANQIKAENIYKYSKLPNELKTAANDKKQLTQSDFSDDANSFLTVGSGEVTIRPEQDGGVIEVKYDALSVTFKGVGTLEISVRSNSTGNLSSIGLKCFLGLTEDEEEIYEYVSATYNSANVTPLEFEAGNMYEVTGKDYITLTFTISHPGTYTLFTSVISPDGALLYDRPARIDGIIKTDVYENTSATNAISVGSLSDINLYNEELRSAE
ncbi:MAG: hypothetical protein HDQ88_08600 [Clostridia bacterium]|nr:hypothetical protein [Clostridia bacterium]